MATASRKWSVYGLVDPREGLIYYVGCSYKPFHRVRAHATTADTKAHIRTRELERCGTPCEVIILSVHDTRREAFRAEGIQIMCRRGLVNGPRRLSWLARFDWEAELSK